MSGASPPVRSTGGPEHAAPQRFRDVIGRFATGVTVVTTHADERDHGMTASAVSSLSLEPPMLLVCINQAAPTGAAMRASGTFAVNVLAEDQADLAYRFATPLDDKFDGVHVRRGTGGAALLLDALAHIECRVVEDVTAGTHTIFIGRVERASGREGAPLAYFRGEFGQLHLARHDPVTALVREQVLSPAGLGPEPPTAEAVAERLDVPAGQVDRALVQLAGEGIVAGDPVHGFSAPPLTARSIDAALDARCAIELGAADLGIGRAGADGLAELARAAARTVELVDEGRQTEEKDGVEVERYAKANAAFHELLVRLAGSAALVDAYRGLSLPGIMMRGIQEAPDLREHASDHVAIAEAYRAGDLAAAKDAIRRHTERTRATHHAELATGT